MRFNAGNLSFNKYFLIHSNFLCTMLSLFGGGSVWIVGWQGEVMLNQMRFFLPSSPFNSPSRGGYWTPTNRTKRKH